MSTTKVSLLVRPDKNIASVKNQIASELDQAQSIKSKETRKKVLSALG